MVVESHVTKPAEMRELRKREVCGFVVCVVLLHDGAVVASSCGGTKSGINSSLSFANSAFHLAPPTWSPQRTYRLLRNVFCPSRSAPSLILLRISLSTASQ